MRKDRTSKMFQEALHQVIMKKLEEGIPENEVIKRLDISMLFMKHLDIIAYCFCYRHSSACFYGLLNI